MSIMPIMPRWFLIAIICSVVFWTVVIGLGYCGPTQKSPLNTETEGTEPTYIVKCHHWIAGRYGATCSEFQVFKIVTKRSNTND